MRFQDFRDLFRFASLGFVLLAATPLLTTLLPLSRSGQPFSEIWLLGPDHMIGGYPFTVEVGEDHYLLLGVTNHLGYSAYYCIYVKFRNQDQPIPDSSTSEPSSIPHVYQFNFFLANEETLGLPLTLQIINVTEQRDSIVINRASINGENFLVDCSSKWDPEYNGFLCQMFFELWLYQVEEEGFRFHGRSVNVWLNMTGDAHA